jgi:hypothetical protein
MSTSHIRTRKGVARAAVAVTTTGVAALALAGPASATLIRQYIEVPQCEQPQTQWCKQVPTVNVRAKADGPWLVEFTGNQNGCSDIIAHIILDGTEWGNHIVHPGGTDEGYEIPLTKGNHVIGVQAEGIEGGCNTGAVGAWGGTLLARTLYDDTNAGMLPPPA